MSPSPDRPRDSGSKKKSKSSSDWINPPPGLPPARIEEEEGVGPYERGRAYWRPEPDFGQSSTSFKLAGLFKVKAGGSGVSGALAVGFAGSAAMVGITAYFALPTAVIVLLGLSPMASVLILVLLLSLKS